MSGEHHSGDHDAPRFDRRELGKKALALGIKTAFVLTGIGLAADFLEGFGVGDEDTEPALHHVDLRDLLRSPERYHDRYTQTDGYLHYVATTTAARAIVIARPDPRIRSYDWREDKIGQQNGSEYQRRWHFALYPKPPDMRKAPSSIDELKSAAKRRELAVVTLHHSFPRKRLEEARSITQLFLDHEGQARITGVSLSRWTLSDSDEAPFSAIENIGPNPDPQPLIKFFPAR